MEGTIAPGEKGGRTVFAPDATHQAPRMMIRTAGMILPRMNPTFRNFVETSGPKYAISVVPQNAIIITLNMYQGLFAMSGVNAKTRVDAMNTRTVGNHTRLFGHSQKRAVNPPFSPHACFTHA